MEDQWRGIISFTSSPNFAKVTKGLPKIKILSPNKVQVESFKSSESFGVEVIMEELRCLAALVDTTILNAEISTNKGLSFTIN